MICSEFRSRVEPEPSQPKDEHTKDGEGDVVAQTQYVLEKIQLAIEQAGGTLSDVVRTRIYVTDREYMMDVAQVHGKFFGTIRPASTGVEVGALVDDRLLVEIEASAIVSSD